MKSFEAELREMRREYVIESAARLTQLQELIDAAVRSGDPEALGPLSRKFHAFTGSGRTYGFERVTAFGAEGEMLCDALRRAGVAPREGRRCMQDLHDRIAEELEGDGRA
jgi:chemotaxis protein histidine kinase CheA